MGERRAPPPFQPQRTAGDRRKEPTMSNRARVLTIAIVLILIVLLFLFLLPVAIEPARTSAP